MNWQPWLTAVTAVSVPALALVGTVWAKRLSRRQDTAQARKTEAEAVSVEVATAQGLLKTVQEWSETRLKEQKTDYESRISNLRSEHDERLKAVMERLAILDEQQRALRAAFAAHEMWDRDAVAALRTTHADWPDPPAIRFD